jgi:argininosuccinate lyase
MAYDYTLVNEDLTLAVAHAGAIIDAETFRTSRQQHLGAALARLREEVQTELEQLPAS